MWFLNLVTCRNFEFCYFLQLVFVYNAQVSTKSGLDPNGVWQAWGYGVFEGWKSERGQGEICPLSENTSRSEPAETWSETSAGDRSAPGVHSQTHSEHGTATLRHRLDLIRSLTFLTQCFYIHCLLYRRLMRTSWPPCVSWRRLSLILLL